MKRIIKKLYLYAVLALVFSMVLSIPAKAIDMSDFSKEENVYVLLDNDGSVKNTYVVNSFTIEKPGTIYDYGSYDSVRNLSTTEELTVSGDQIAVVNASKGMFHYQGNLSNAEIPWLFSISYLLDGKEVPAEELSGKDGHIDINISIRINPKSLEGFSKHFAIQTSAALNAEKCTAITAEGATIANAGSSKMVTFTMLPGEGADYKISFEAADFHMEGIQFSALPITMNIAIPETGVFANKLSGLSEGIAGINNGTQELSSGAAKLKEGANKLNNGMESMKEGIQQMTNSLSMLKNHGNELSAGSSEILIGLDSIISGLDDFNPAALDLTEIVNGSAGIKIGIDSLSTGLEALKGSFKEYKAQLNSNGLQADAVLESNTQMVLYLDEQINILKTKQEAAIPGSEKYIELATYITTYEKMSQLLKGNNAVIAADAEFIKQLESSVVNITSGSMDLKNNYTLFNAGIEEIPSRLNKLPQSIGQLKHALDTLTEGYRKLNDSIGKYTQGVSEAGSGFEAVNEGFKNLANGSGSLYEGISDYYDGVKRVAEGTQQMRNETSSMDSDIEDAVNEIFESYTGGEFEAVSYVSSKNTNVKAVQFVIKTQEIEEFEQVATVKKENTKMSFWERLLSLFGL